MEHSHRKARFWVILTNFKEWCFNISHSRHQSVELINLINIIHVVFIGFVKFEKKSDGSRLTEKNVVFGLVSHDCRQHDCTTADWSSIFSEPFYKTETALIFFFVLDYASRIFSMPRHYLYCAYLLLNHVKYYLNSQDHPPLCNDDVNPASVL